LEQFSQNIVNFVASVYFVNDSFQKRKVLKDLRQIATILDSKNI